MEKLCIMLESIEEHGGGGAGSEIIGGAPCPPPPPPGPPSEIIGGATGPPGPPTSYSTVEEKLAIACHQTLYIIKGVAAPDYPLS